MFKTPTLGALGLGSRGIGALALKRMARSDQQQGAWDLRDAQNIFSSEPALLGGIWLPDLAMMKQDSTGQTDSATGAVVGHVSNVSKRPSTIITNDEFSSATGWTTDTGWTIANGVATFVGGTPGYLSWASGVSTGETYLIKIVVNSITSGASCSVYIGQSPSAGAFTSSGTYYYCGPAPGTAIGIAIRGNSTNINHTVVIKSVSAIKVGAAALQPTSANKPTLLNWQSTGKYGFFPSADNIALTATFPSSLGSACTEFVTTPDGVEILENRTVGTTYNIADRHFFGRILLNRACSPYEKALFTRMLTRYIPKTSLYKYDFAITQTGGGAVDLKIVTASATPVYIEWGDGTGGTVASNTTLSHTYAATYTGNVRVSSLSPITSLTSNNGKWSFNLSSLPSGLTYFYCAGSNTVTGNLSSLPSGMTYFYCSGSNTISDYSGRVWANNQVRVYHVPVSPGGLSSAKVDQLLIDLASAGGTWSGDKAVYLAGTNAARTSASDAAVSTLQGKGVTVTTN